MSCLVTCSIGFSPDNYYNNKCWPFEDSSSVVILNLLLLLEKDDKP